MAVQRYDLNKCIGCMHCVTVCPMDVFRFDTNAFKSVIAYPENCQSCGQCFMGCQGRSLEMSFYAKGYQIPAIRAVAADSATPETVKEAIVAKLYEEPEESSGGSWGGKS